MLLEIEPDDDLMVECIDCGADVYDLRLVGQHHEPAPMSSGGSADRQLWRAGPAVLRSYASNTMMQNSLPSGSAMTRH